MPGNFSDQRGSLFFSIKSTSINQKFNFSLSSGYFADNNQLPAGDLTSSAISLAPNGPALFNKDGSLNWMPDANEQQYYGPIPYSQLQHLSK